MSNRIKQYRQQAKLSQVQMAEELGVTQPLISQWERGINYPAAPQLIKIRDLFHRRGVMVTIDEILGLPVEDDEAEWIKALNL